MRHILLTCLLISGWSMVSLHASENMIEDPNSHIKVHRIYSRQVTPHLNMTDESSTKKKHKSSHHSKKESKKTKKSHKKIKAEIPVDQHDVNNDTRGVLGHITHTVGDVVKFFVHGVGYVIHPHHDVIDSSTPIIQTNSDAEETVSKGLSLFKKTFRPHQKGVESFAIVLALFDEWSEATRPHDTDAHAHLTQKLKEFQADLGKKILKAEAHASDLLGIMTKTENDVNRAQDRGLILDTINGVKSHAVSTVDHLTDMAMDGADFITKMLKNRLDIFREHILDGTTVHRVDTFFNTVEGVVNATVKISPVVAAALVTYPPAAAAFNIVMTGINMYGRTLSNQEKAIESVIAILKKRLESTHGSNNSVVTP